MASFTLRGLVVLAPVRVGVGIVLAAAELELTAVRVFAASLVKVQGFGGLVEQSRRSWKE